MENRGKLPFHAAFERDARGSHLVLKLELDDLIHEYQVEMLMNNDVPSLLPFNLRQKDANRYLFYDVTSKLQLGQLLTRRKLQREELIRLLVEILQGIIESENYLLHHQGFIIDEDFLFIHPETLQISLLYIPTKIGDKNTTYELKAFINRLIWSINPQEETNDKFLLKILYELNKETFNLRDFLKFLRQQQTQIGEEPLIKSLSNNRSNEVNHQNISKAVEEKKIIKSKEEVALTLEEEVILGYSKKTKLTILLAEVVILIMIALLSLETSILIDSTGRIDGLSVMGLLFLVGAVNVLLLKKLLVKEDIVTVKTHKPKKPSLKMNVKEINSISKKLDFSVEPIKNNRNNSSKNHDEVGEFLHTEIIEVRKDSPQLISLHGGQRERIVIDKTPFFIGKLKEQVDYIVNSKTVSRVHGEISCLEGQYYLKDLNSRNGTYLNGERINSNVEYPLKNDDQITFADSEYIFNHPLKYGEDYQC